MAILKIARMGHPVLLQNCEPVTDPGAPEIRRLVADMKETMEDAGGAGLAAPQVHVPLRLFVFWVSEARGLADPDDIPVGNTVVINPEVELLTDVRVLRWEGCLSIPDVYGDVERPAGVRVRAMDLDGKVFEIEGTELFGRCLQHEIDHLHGKLFVDYLSVLKRRSAMSKWTKEKDKYPGFVRRIENDPALKHEHPDEEL